MGVCLGWTRIMTSTHTYSSNSLITSLTIVSPMESGSDESGAPYGANRVSLDGRSSMRAHHGPLTIQSPASPSLSSFVISVSSSNLPPSFPSLVTLEKKRIGGDRAGQVVELTSRRFGVLVIVEAVGRGWSGGIMVVLASKHCHGGCGRGTRGPPWVL